MADATERRRRITIIDDHAEFRDLMRDVLSLRHDVVALSGQELSPDDLVDSRPDLLIVDLRLDTRELQGWDILTLARAHRDLRNTPIIVCSADIHSLNGRADSVLDAGNAALLAKPFALETVEEMVTQGLAIGFPGGTWVHSTGSDDYQVVLEESADAVLVADGEGRYVDANEVALRLLGLTREELLQRTVVDLVALDQAWTDAEWQRYQRSGWWHGGVTLSLPDGQSIRMLATARILTSGDGQTTYVSWLKPVDERVAAETASDA